MPGNGCKPKTVSLLEKQSDQGVPCLLSLITNIFFENRKRKMLEILEHLPYLLFENLLLFNHNAI